ncbi:MAG TPA: hypothetical protein VKX39_11335 [Bryobacteraceae bacterium]|nr:hypothetical protein [Bryobacteraceae bacterium]
MKELGIDCLRYGPPYYRVHQGPGKYDWEFADQTLGAARSNRLSVFPGAFAIWSAS